MDGFTLEELQAFIVRAKARTYVGKGEPSPSCRPASHDLAFEDGPFAYLDSYYGGHSFLGEEIIYYQGQAVWGMNYYGRVSEDDQISGSLAGQVIQESLSKLYKEGRFLGGFENVSGEFTYTDTNDGDVRAFTGKEWISRAGQRVYELVYHGGMIK